MNNLLMITAFTLCSAVGAGLRLGLTSFAKTVWGQAFYGTLLVNLIGAACIGVFYVVFSEVWQQVDKSWYAIIVAGLLGSLTTFSGFSLEIVTMLMQKQWFLAIGYAMFSLCLCVLVTFLTVKLTHWAILL